MTVGDRIRERREYLGISQIELAKRIHVLKQTLYKYEKNVITNIPLDKIEEIAEILKVSPSYLMGWQENLVKEKAEFSELIPDILSNGVLTEHIKKLIKLNTEHQHTIYDNIAYWYEKEGH